MSSKKSSNKSLSEKIAESFIPRPLQDPEVDSEDETVAKLTKVTAEDDYDILSSCGKNLSDIRKRNIKHLSELSKKYHGEVSSRQEMQESDGQDDKDEYDDDLEEYRNQLNNYQIDSDSDEAIDSKGDIDEESDISDDNENEGAEQDSDYDSSASNEEDNSYVESDEQNNDNKVIEYKNEMTDINKGLSVQNQLKIWEKLLEVRIHSQKLLVNANSLPLPDLYNNFCEKNKDFLKLANEAQKNVTGLLEKMLEMQQMLLKQYPETKTLLSGTKRKSNVNEIEDVPIKRFAHNLEQNFQDFHSYRNSVLQKWYDRTKILAPGAGNKSKSMNNFDVVKKIEAVLFNKNELIKKSQNIKGNYRIFGEKISTEDKNNVDISQLNDERMQQSEDENDIKQSTETTRCAEIYDDTDFYHQQLRELIEFKTNTLSNPAEMSKQFAELQKLRQKMKKKVDTRASKGRKLRYVVHNKLVNFMAPNDTSTWTDESKDELYRSLFVT